MTTLFIIMIIIIILSILYLYFRDIQYKKILENFDNTQSSLSTYYLNDDNDKSLIFSEDEDNKNFNNNYSLNNIWVKKPLFDNNLIKNNENKFKNTVNSFNNNQSNDVIKNAGWNGIWRTSDLSLNAQFIQNNDKIIMSFSNILFDNIYSDYTKSSDKCINNLFLGIGQLNKYRNKFILTKIICNKYRNSSLILEAYKFSGKIDGNTITLYSNTIRNYLTIQRISELVFNSDDLNIKNRYINENSRFVNSSPLIPDSEFEYSENLCPSGSSPCVDIQDGISLTSYQNLDYNACGRTMSSTNNKCNGIPECILYGDILNNIPSCSVLKQTYDYMNYSAFTNISQTTGNSLNICYDYLKYFPESCNACIFCYVTNLGTVLTLNYEFFGTLPDQNNLTVQNDNMNEYLNNTDMNIGLLPDYRSIILNNFNDNSNNNLYKTVNALSFTNIIENDNINNYCSDIIEKSIIKCNNYVNNYKPSIINKNFIPCIWQINSNNNTQYNLTNSCPITISTSQNYDSSVKYIGYDDKGNVSLSLYSGGINQQFILDNMKIIKKNDDPGNSSVAITTNLKGNNGLYLIPSNFTTGFSNNSNIINMIADPEENGKWLILGFTINNMADLLSTIKKINFDNLS